MLLLFFGHIDNKQVISQLFTDKCLSMHFISAHNARMNLDHIKLFVAVYKVGSFAAVAKDLNMAASSVSRAVSTLEEQLSTRLFQRTTRTLTPTQAGERYFQQVEALVEEFDLAHQDMLQQTQTPSGRLRITASVSFSQAIIIPLLAAFRQQYPNIVVELTLSDEPANLVSNQFDIAIRHGKLSDSSLVARKLMDVNYLLVATPNYLKHAKPVIKPVDIQQHSLISFIYPTFSKEWLFKTPESLQSISIQPILKCSSATAIKECIKNHMGLGLLPDWSIKQEIKNRELIHLLPQWHASGKNEENAIWLVYPSRAFMPAKTAAFADFLMGYL